MIQMRHTAHELRVTLDQVLQGGEAAVAPQTADEPVTFITEPEAQMRAAPNVSDVSVMTCSMKFILMLKRRYLSKKKISFVVFDS